MNIGPLGALASAAGAPLSQSTGSDTVRARRDATSHERGVQSIEKAESAAGIGPTDGEQHETTDRDADGRLPYERQHAGASHQAEQTDPFDGTPHSKDASGDSGHQLDLLG